MHNLKQTLKYNKKVYIVPHDKLHTIVAEEPKDDISTTSVKPDTGSSEVTHQADSGITASKDHQEKSDERWQSSLSPTQLRSALAIMHILGFEPDTHPHERAYLLYTQLDGDTPSNVLDLYHRLAEKEIPLYLIGNKRLKSRIKRMRHLHEDADDDSDPQQTNSPNDSTSSISGGEDEQDYTKALLLYAAKANALNKKKQKTRKRKIHGSSSAGIKKPKSDSTRPHKATNSFKMDDGSTKDWVHIF